MNTFVFIITVMVNGVMNPITFELISTSPQCVEEQQYVAAINRTNVRHGIDTLYFGECRTR